MANGSYSIKLPPGTYTVMPSAPSQSCGPSAPATVTITDGVTTTFSTCLTGSTNIVVGATAVSGGNGNGIIDSNECNQLSVTLNNAGCSKTTGIFVTLATSTPGVTITQPNAPYPN